MLEMPELVLGPSAAQATQTIFEVGAPLSPFHYHLRKVGILFIYLFFGSVGWRKLMETQAWRIPYLEEKIHEQFRTHIYGWVSRAPGGGGS